MRLSHRGGKVRQVAKGVSDGQNRERTGIEIGFDLDGAGEEVELDFVTILHTGDGTADGGLGAAMHAHRAARDAGDARVGERATLP
jgi:hypothetical protein